MPDAKNPVTPGQIGALECSICGTSGVALQLMQCRICRRRFCDDCAVRSRTGLFCSDQCAKRFFHGEGDEEPGELDEDYDE